jgi:hypothetical protein
MYSSSAVVRNDFWHSPFIGFKTLIGNGLIYTNQCTVKTYILAFMNKVNICFFMVHWLVYINQ